MGRENDLNQLSTFKSQTKKKTTTSYLIRKRRTRRWCDFDYKERKKSFHTKRLLLMHTLVYMCKKEKCHILSSFIPSFFCLFFNLFHQLNSTPLYHCSFFINKQINICVCMVRMNQLFFSYIYIFDPHLVDVGERKKKKTSCIVIVNICCPHNNNSRH